MLCLTLSFLSGFRTYLTDLMFGRGDLGGMMSGVMGFVNILRLGGQS